MVPDKKDTAMNIDKVVLIDVKFTGLTLTGMDQENIISI